MRKIPITAIVATFLSLNWAATANNASTATVSASTNASAGTHASSTATVPSGPSLYNFTVSSLDGKPIDLGLYRGQVALVVNTASKCGFTPQYAGLEKLYEDYKDKGFVILGFPSNDFGNQEPGTAQEISAFCASKFKVTFPMFEKITTHGDKASPVYQFLATGHGVPQWNFHKYLVDKSGKVIGEFTSQVAPDSKELREAIDTAIGS